jgi:hypothetical protein
MLVQIVILYLIALFIYHHHEILVQIILYSYFASVYLYKFSISFVLSQLMYIIYDLIFIQHRIDNHSLLMQLMINKPQYQNIIF